MKDLCSVKEMSFCAGEDRQQTVSITIFLCNIWKSIVVSVVHVHKLRLHSQSEMGKRKGNSLFSAICLSLRKLVTYTFTLFLVIFFCMASACVQGRLRENLGPVAKKIYPVCI